MTSKGIDKEYIEKVSKAMESYEFIKLHQQITNVNFVLVHSVSKNMMHQYCEAGKVYECLVKMKHLLPMNKVKRQTGPILTKKQLCQRIMIIIDKQLENC